jgi:hypothetical protein
LRGSKRSERERVSLLLVELRAAPNWLRTRFDRGPVPSSRIVNVLGRETSLEDRPPRSSSYPAGLSRGVWLPAAPRRSTNSPVRTKWTRMPDARTGHWTRTRHWISDARTPGARTLDMYRTPDTGHVPDAGHWTAGRGHWTAGRWTCGRGQGDQGTVGRRPVLLWAAHAALGNHDGSTVRYLPARDCRLYCHAAAGSRRRRPSGASAHCCRVLELDGTRRGQWDYGKVRCAGLGWCGSADESVGRVPR